MKNVLYDVVINCPIHEKNHSLLMASKRKINQTNRPVEKSIYAEDVEEYANTLLKCRICEESREDCINCHLFANRQKKSIGAYLGNKVLV